MQIGAINANVYVAEWISAHVYCTENKNIAFIFNQKTNEFIVLEDSAAILFKFLLEKQRDYYEIINFSKSNGLDSEIESFLEELVSINILLINKIDRNEYCSIDNKDKQIQNSSIEEFAEFENKMSGIIISMGFMPRLCFELTYNCNLKCIHCYNDKNLKTSNIKLNDIKKVIDDAYELGVFYITLTGGECTLNPNFLEIISYIREKKIALEFLTNGQLLYDNKILLERIINLHPYRISLSLYSMKPEIHDKITGVVGSYQKTLNVIKILKENNINIEIKCFLTNINAYEYTDVSKFAKKNNIAFSVDYTLLDNPEKTNRKVKITNEQLLNLLLDNNSSAFINNNPALNINEKFQNEQLCGGASTGLSIDPNLNVYPCPALKILLGNCNNDSLIAIWKDQNKKSKLNILKSQKILDLEQCYKEEYCKYCGYCPGIAYTAGFYMQPYSDFCEIAKIKMKAAKLLNI